MEDPKLGQYNLSIRAVDSGIPQRFDEQVVSVDVPVNFPPNLDEGYEFSIFENVSIGHQIGQITATDWNVDSGQGDELKYFTDEGKATRESSNLLLTEI